MDAWMYRQSILDIVPIGLSRVINLSSLVPFIYSKFICVLHISAPLGVCLYQGSGYFM